MKKLLLILLTVCAFANIINAQAPGANKGANSAQGKAYHKHWGRSWRVWDQACNNPGAYCFSRASITLGEALKTTNLETDEGFGVVTAALKGNNIMVNIVDIKSNISLKTFTEFKQHKIRLNDVTIPANILSEWLKIINLEGTKEDLIIKTSEQKYTVENSTYENKEVGIIETLMQTKLVIGSKEYSLILSVASGKSDSEGVKAANVIQKKENPGSILKCRYCKKGFDTGAEVATHEKNCSSNTKVELAK